LLSLYHAVTATFIGSVIVLSSDAFAFVCHCNPLLLHLHPFPTRRSSDLSSNTTPGERCSCDTITRSARIIPFRGSWVEFTIDIQDRKSTRLNSSHGSISYAVFCLKKKKKQRHAGAGNQLSGTDGTQSQRS